MKSLSIISLLSLGLIVLSSCSHSESKNITSSHSIEQSGYLRESKTRIEQLSPEDSIKREELLAKLKTNPVYQELVIREKVTPDYLQVLSLISEGLILSHTEGFGLPPNQVNDVTNSENGKSKMEFVTSTLALAGNKYGGIPRPIIAVFERYDRTFHSRGVQGLFIDSEGRQHAISTPFDFTAAMVVFNQSNSQALENYFEAQLASTSPWKNTVTPLFAFLSNKSEFLNLLEQAAPNSKYILNVDFELTPQELVQAYEANEITADTKYKGRTIALTGKISDIGKDVLDKPYVAFESSSFNNVTCYFEKTDGLEELQKGSTYTIYGQCEGSTVNLIIINDSQVWLY